MCLGWIKALLNGVHQVTGVSREAGIQLPVMAARLICGTLRGCVTASV